jgi:hypothetical protein
MSNRRLYKIYIPGITLEKNGLTFDVSVDEQVFLTFDEAKRFAEELESKAKALTYRTDQEDQEVTCTVIDMRVPAKKALRFAACIEIQLAVAAADAADAAYDAAYDAAMAAASKAAGKRRVNQR